MANQGLEKLSDNLQSGINTLLGAKGPGRHPIKSLLNGSWLGHPLHPVLTDVAVGGVILTAIFDILWLAGHSTVAWSPRAAEATLIAGLAGMAGSIVTGLADWADTYGPERRVGLIHGALNILAFVVFIVAFLLRLSAADGRSIVGAIIGFVVLGLISLAAFLGGDLVFKHGTNVNHTAWEHGTEDFVAVGALAEIPDNKLVRVEVGGVPVVLLRLGEKVAAIAATCTHAGGPLDEGVLKGDIVTCPWHGSKFHMSDGKVVDGPATIAQPRYTVRIRDGVVELQRA